MHPDLKKISDATALALKLPMTMERMRIDQLSFAGGIKEIEAEGVVTLTSEQARELCKVFNIERTMQPVKLTFKLEIEGV